MSTKYYQDELNYLRELGREFADRHPEAARFLSEAGRDPDVERLLQGFAFLAARLHERLDDQYSQVAEAFLQILWPQALRPTPAMTVVQFKPLKGHLRSDLRLPAGLHLDSRRYAWGRHRFRTCREVAVYPFELAGPPTIHARGDTSFIQFSFELLPGASLDEAALDKLSIYVDGSDRRFTYGWYLWLTQHVKEAVVKSDRSEATAPVSVRPMGLDDPPGTSVWDRDEIPGHHLLREYLAMPQQFLFFQIDGLQALKQWGVQSRFDLVIDFGGRIPSGPVHQIKPDSFKLYCAPAANLWPATARLTLDHARSEYLVRPDDLDIEHAEVYTVDRVLGYERSVQGRTFEYHPYYSRTAESGESHRAGFYYRTRFADIQARRGDRHLRGKDCFLSFGAPPSADLAEAVHTMSLDLTCCHRGGATELAAGDLCEPTEEVPTSVSFGNLMSPTDYHPAPLSPDKLWFLVSSLAVGRQTLATTDRLRAAFDLHAESFSSRRDVIKRLIERISSFTVAPEVTVENGIPVRVLTATIEFDCEAEAVAEHYAFGVVVGEFLRQVASVNARVRARITFRHDRALEYIWPQRRGTCLVL